MSGDYPFFQIEKRPAAKTAILYFNRPEKLNAMNWPFWRDLPAVVKELEEDREILVVVIAGLGKSFSVGLDVMELFINHQEALNAATAPAREKLRQLILTMQEGIRMIARSEKIYIAAIHRHCIGAGLDIASACDLRLAAADAVFSLRETKISIVADMGSLNLLPGIIGQANTRFLAYTGRDIDAAEALRMGLISAVYEGREILLESAIELSAEITANSEAAVRGTKKILQYMENHSAQDGMDYVANWNAAFLDIKEIENAIVNAAAKKK